MFDLRYSEEYNYGLRLVKLCKTCGCEMGGWEYEYYGGKCVNCVNKEEEAK